MRGRVRVGTQGWSYGEWSGPFYPSGASAGDWLGLYARAFDVVEVDSTFYALPPRERFESWRERTSDGFLFTLKMPGEVTHERRLRDPRPALRFCEEARVLGPRLGPILVQLPPGFGPAEADVVAAFVRALPADLRYAVEFRDRAWLVDDTVAMLAECGAVPAVSTGPWLAEPEARTFAAGLAGGLLYLRWMGAPRHERDVGSLLQARDRELARWAELIREAEAVEGSEVYAFFNNDYQGHAPASARRLQALLGQAPVSPRELSPQTELFG